MFRYIILEVSANEKPWQSEELCAETESHVRQTIVAGFAPGKIRMAIGDRGRVICALDARGYPLQWPSGMHITTR